MKSIHPAPAKRIARTQLSASDLKAILDRPVAFHAILARIAGSANAGLFLSQAIYWTPRAQNADGWFYKTREEWHEETVLSRYEQETARKRLRSLGFLVEERRGQSGHIFYRVDLEAVARAIKARVGAGGKPPLQRQKTPRSNGGKPPAPSVTFPPLLLSETTSETTQRSLHSERMSEEISALSMKLQTHGIPVAQEGLPLKRKTPRVPTENVSRANGEAPMPKRETLQKRPENSKNDSSLRASDEDENFSELISALCAQGVPEGQARSAAATHAVELRRRLSFLPFVEVRKSPGAFLMARLDTEYHEPPGAAKKREAAARSVQASKAKANADETRQAEEAAQQRAQQESAALDAVFSSMPPQTQRVIVEDAKRAAPQLAPFGKWTPTAEQIAVREELRRRAAGASADLT